MRTYVRAVVRDKNGRIIKDTGWRETNTLTRNFYAFLHAFMSNKDTPCVTIDGTEGMIAAPTSSGLYLYLYSEPNYYLGLVVGTGTKSPTRDDYDLERPIPPPRYGHSFINLDDNCVLLTRTFWNTTGNDLTIREVGLVAAYSDSLSDGTEGALIARSLFTVTIPDGGSATIYYRIVG